jgi:hypothetical protein
MQGVVNLTHAAFKVKSCDGSRATGKEQSLRETWPWGESMKILTVL